jgi:hypothetical protein
MVKKTITVTTTVAKTGKAYYIDNTKIFHDAKNPFVLWDK